MHYLSECLIIKNENQYLIEHLTQNAQSGIEHFYIYDNISDKPVSNFLKENVPELLDLCSIELFSGKNQAQTECYAKFLADHRHDTQWCAFIDTDEIFDGGLMQLFEANDDYYVLQIQQTMHGANGEAFYNPTKTMTETFAPHVLQRLSPMTKCVCQITHIVEQSAHNAHIKGDTKRQKFIPANDTCRLHHYFFRSFEEWLQKIQRGAVRSRMSWKLNMFFVENSIPDADRDYLLKKYGLTLNSRMTYNAN